jgi:acetyltransferase
VSAEFAVSVAESSQGRGLASLMLRKLACRAASAGIRHLRGETLATNDKMVHLARKAGFTIAASSEIAGLLVLNKELEAPQPGRNCSGLDTATAAAA